MRFRLWHVLALMGLILLAGVLSVQQLEAHVGRSTVPGLVIIDAPELDAIAAEGAIRRWPGALLQWAPADDAPLSPFVPAAIRRLRAKGHASALLVPRRTGAAAVEAAAGDGLLAAAGAPAPGEAPAADAALHDAWGVLVAGQGADEASAALAAYVASCDGVRPFVLGLLLQSPTPAELLAAVARQVDAAETLPSFRRTTVLLLGAREPQSQRRIVVRIDRGDVDRLPPPALKDLLADTQ